MNRRFWNINHGTGGVVDHEGDTNKAKLHKDRFFDDKSTHRVLDYHSENGGTGSIIFRNDANGEEVELRAPPGCGFRIDRVRWRPLELKCLLTILITVQPRVLFFIAIGSPRDNIAQTRQ